MAMIDDILKKQGNRQFNNDALRSILEESKQNTFSQDNETLTEMVEAPTNSSREMGM